MLPFHRILCPTDFSPLSDQAVQAAVELAAHFDAELYLVHVLPTAMPITGFPAPVVMPDGELYGDARRAEHENAEKMLRELIASHVPAGVRTSFVVRRGDATLEILRAAEIGQVDLIVMATHGATGWRRMLSGSVAEEEVRLAPCPVLSLHALQRQDTDFDSTVPALRGGDNHAPQ